LYFSFGGQFYKQTYGVAMASPLSSMITNFNMVDFEEKALDRQSFGSSAM
jgi:hypothetical protein